MIISLLAAYTKDDYIIGAQGKIPWKLPSERDFFKKICSGKYVIMGRKSFEEIGKALSYCTLVIISSTLEASIPGVVVVHSVEEAIEFINVNQKNKQTVDSPQKRHMQQVHPGFCKNKKQDFLQENEILVAGGESIYRQTFHLASKIYATEIDLKIKGDSHFPVPDQNWQKTILETKTENKISYDYVIYTRQRGTES